MTSVMSAFSSSVLNATKWVGFAFGARAAVNFGELTIRAGEAPFKFTYGKLPMCLQGKVDLVHDYWRKATAYLSFCPSLCNNQSLTAKELFQSAVILAGAGIALNTAADYFGGAPDFLNGALRLMSNIRVTNESYYTGAQAAFYSLRDFLGV